MRRVLSALLLVAALLAGGPLAAATDPNEILRDPALEARARELSKQLRCLVCQNQSIDDSDAELARDLRRLVREQLQAGRSDEEIIAFLTARYGDFVLLKPPVKPATFGLWLGPFVVLAVGGLGLLVWVRRRPGAQALAAGTDELTPTEQRRLRELIGQQGRAE